MTNDLSETTVNAWARLLRAQQTLLERVEADLKAADLPPLGWYDVLLEVNREEPRHLRPFEICERVLINKYNASRLLDRLEKEGLVKRMVCAEDGRGLRIAIIQKGKALLKKMWPVYERAIQRYFERHLSGAEIRQLDDLMGRLIANPVQR